MEPFRSFRRSRRLRALVLTGAVVGAAALAPPAHASPDPSAKELKTQAYKLADQLERLTEQYNGLKVKLQQSQQAARVAKANAGRQQKALEGLRSRFAGLAADAYMHDGDDPTAAFVASQDPQTVLDQTAALNYFATQNGTRVLELMQAMQGAERARKAAEDRAAQVAQLRAQLADQRKKITALYEKVRNKVVKQDPSQLAKLPVFGESRAAQALRIAMSKIGSPYVWGAAGPSTFDCSGLVMWAYHQVGINLPHYTGSQFTAGVHVSQSQLRPGDLVFFYSDLHHVGLYVGGGKMLHAPHTGDVVKIASMAGRPFAGAVRVA